MRKKGAYRISCKEKRNIHQMTYLLCVCTMQSATKKNKKNFESTTTTKLAKNSSKTSLAKKRKKCQ